MTADETLEKLASELFEAAMTRTPIPLISKRHPEFGVDEAYRVSLGVLERRRAAGERLVGKKIGLTAKAVQDMLGIDEPDFGFMTDAMALENGAETSIAETMLTPMIEAEIALVLKSDLPMEGVTPEQVLDATEFAAPSFELVDTRFDTPKIAIVDTVADNASCAFFALGDERVDPRRLSLPDISCKLYCDGELISEGAGAAVMGSPLNSVAWLANRLGAFGVRLEAGDVVLPGSVVPFAAIAPGQSWRAEFSGLGSVSLSFR